jgi:hypothetical protein
MDVQLFTDSVLKRFITKPKGHQNNETNFRHVRRLLDDVMLA